MSTCQSHNALMCQVKYTTETETWQCKYTELPIHVTFFTSFVCLHYFQTKQEDISFLVEIYVCCNLTHSLYVEAFNTSDHLQHF